MGLYAGSSTYNTFVSTAITTSPLAPDGDYVYLQVTSMSVVDNNSSTISASGGGVEQGFGGVVTSTSFTFNGIIKPEVYTTLFEEINALRECLTNKLNFEAFVYIAIKDKNGTYFKQRDNLSTLNDYIKGQIMSFSIQIAGDEGANNNAKFTMTVRRAD